MPIVNTLLNYPQPFGTRKINVVKWQGSNNYQAGGESVTAAQFGWGSFDRGSGALSVNANNSGNYNVQVRLPTGQAGNTVLGGSNNVTIIVTAANGTEVANNTNLSGEFAHLELIGG